MQHDHEDLNLRLACVQYAIANSEAPLPTPDLIERAEAIYGFLTARPRENPDREKMN